MTGVACECGINVCNSVEYCVKEHSECLTSTSNLTLCCDKNFDINIVNF